MSLPFQNALEKLSVHKFHEAKDDIPLMTEDEQEYYEEFLEAYMQYFLRKEDVTGAEFEEPLKRCFQLNRIMLEMDYAGNPEKGRKEKIDAICNALEMILDP